MNNVAQNGGKSIIGAIKIDKKEVQEHLNTLVRESVGRGSFEQAPERRGGCDLQCVTV